MCSCIRHSQRAEDNPFEADFDLAPQSQPETSQPSATSSSQSKLGKRLASIKQMNTSMNKSAKQMLKSDNVRKLQDAMKVGLPMVAASCAVLCLSQF